jgi:ribose-phosphate pyrophosphokinase
MKNTKTTNTTVDAESLVRKLMASGRLDRKTAFEVGQMLIRLSGPVPLVFGTPRYRKFAKQLVAASGGRLELGKEERKFHPDKKRWQRYVSSIDGRQMIVVGGTQTDTDLAELLKMGYNAWLWKASGLTFLIPYHGDARQERALLKGESVDGAYTSMMIAKVPKCLPAGNNVLLVDIHSDTITGIFIGAEVRCRNIEVLEQLITHVVVNRFGGKCRVAGVEEQTIINPNIAAAAPDAGRGKVITRAARRLGLRAAIVIKTRNGAVIESEGLVGDVSGCLVILSDDIAATLGSAIGAGELLKKAGALEIEAVMTHGVIPHAKYVQKLIDSGLFKALHITDSLPHVHRLAKKFPNFVHVISLPPLLAPELVP